MQRQDNGSEFINSPLFDCCPANKITFPRSRASHSNDGARVEQENRTHVRELVGYHRYDTAAELALLNEIWDLDRVFTNYSPPQPDARVQTTQRRESDEEI